MAGLIIIDNSGNKVEDQKEIDINCAVCTYPEDITELQKIFNLFQKEKTPAAIKTLYNDKICQYHKNRFNSLKVYLNKEMELFEYDAKGTTIATAKEITEEEYNKAEPDSEEDEEDATPLYIGAEGM